MTMWGETDWWKGIQSKNGANALIGLGAGLLQGNTFAKGLAAGGQGFMQGAQLDQQYAMDATEDAKRQAETNQTAEWIKANYPQFADLPPAEGFKLAAQQAALDAKGAAGFGANAPSNVQEWEYYSQLTPEEQTQYLNMKRTNSPLNIGTGFVTQDPAKPGTIIGAPITIDNRTPAYDAGYGSVEGKTDAENAELYESVSSKMPGLKSVVDQLAALSDTATYSQSGQAMDAVKREFGVPVGQGAIDRASYIAIVDNQVLPLLKDTFGAAFTVQEGESLRATLGNPDLSPPEKKAVLDAFIEQKYRDVEAMRRKAPGQNGGGQTFVYNPATRKLEPQ